jgi:hypothetical protein
LFTPQTLSSSNPVVYASLLLNVQSPTTATTNRMLACLATGNTSAPSVAAGLCIDALNQLYVTKNSLTPAAVNTPPLSAGTHLIVWRYKWVSGTANDEVDLWVDPGSLGMAENRVPTPTISTTANADVTAIESFYFLDYQSSSGTFWLDEARVGTTWADVTPSTGGGGGGNSVVITSIVTSGTDLILGGSAGSTNANGTYSVLASTNVALSPRSSWTVLATSQPLDGSGNFSYTASNALGSGLPNQFYLISVP